MGRKDRSVIENYGFAIVLLRQLQDSLGFVIYKVDCLRVLLEHSILGTDSLWSRPDLSRPFVYSVIQGYNCPSRVPKSSFRVIFHECRSLRFVF